MKSKAAKVGTKSASAEVEPKAERKVPLYEAQGQLQLIEEMMSQLEYLAIGEAAELEREGMSQAELEQLIEQKSQAIAAELAQMQQESQEHYGQAVNRMLNRAAYEIRQWVAQEAIAKFHRRQAATLAQEVDCRKRRVRSIKQTIATSLIMLGQRRLDTTQHKMNLTTRVGVVIEEERVPGLERLLALNHKYPGILNQLKFSEGGTLVDVEFRREVLKRLLATGEPEVLEDLGFAALVESKNLVVPTISESKMTSGVKLVETQYGVEIGE